MESKNNDYHISFFKPTTKHARLNRNMVVWFVSIWAIGVFGFQIALRLLEKPTPQQAYLEYQEVWDNVRDEKANGSEYAAFSKATLSVLGKHFVKKEHSDALSNGLSWSVYQLADSAQKVYLENAIPAFEKLKAEIEDITDPMYVQAKNELASYIKPIVGFQDTDVRYKLLPSYLHSNGLKSFEENNKSIMEESMSTYLIHNQSVLTDMKVLGFPFHYFYTAVFLLILFVGLCLAYCVITDRINLKLNIQD